MSDAPRPCPAHPTAHIPGNTPALGGPRCAASVPRLITVAVAAAAVVALSGCGAFTLRAGGASPSASASTSATTSANVTPKAGPAPSTTELLQSVINRVGTLKSAQRKATHPSEGKMDISDEYGQLDGSNCYAKMVKEDEMLIETFVVGGFSYSYQSERLGDTSKPFNPEVKYVKEPSKTPAAICLKAQDLDELTTLAATDADWPHTGNSTHTSYMGKDVYQVTSTKGIEMYVDTASPMSFVITVDPKAHITTEYAQFDAVPLVVAPPADKVK